MIESIVLGGLVTLFKAAFAGEDLDRKVGAKVIGTVIDGLLRTTSKTDPVLLQIQQDVKDLRWAPYDQAMTSGHRYLEEARLSTADRSLRLGKARDQLVAAASAAEDLDLPLLIANAEFAIAKCDVLMTEPAHARMALRRSSAAIERGIEELDVSANVYRALTNAKFEQDASLGKWFERLTSGSGVIKKADIGAAETSLRRALDNLVVLTDLYSEVQTATLAAAGGSTPVVWGQAASDHILAGLRDKAVVSVETGIPVSGFGLVLTVERQVVWRPDNDLVVDLLLSIIAIEDRRLYCSAENGLGEPSAITPDAAALRDAHPAPWLVPPGTTSLTLPEGRYLGWLRAPAHGESIHVVNLRPYRITGNGQASTGGCMRIAIRG